MKIRNLFLHYGGTTKHKLWVAYYLLKFTGKLIWRAIVHDISKYTWNESQGFIKVIDKLKTSTYGSEEYRATLRSIKPSVEWHQAINRHHPEFHEECMRGMTLVDRIEMMADWLAAKRRHNNGNIDKSFEVNRKRFRIPPSDEALLREIVGIMES